MPFLFVSVFVATFMFVYFSFFSLAMKKCGKKFYFLVKRC